MHKVHLTKKVRSVFLLQTTCLHSTSTCGVIQLTAVHDAVKAFKSLAGEDKKLKEAYKTFLTAVERERGIVASATFAGVERLQVTTKALQGNFEEFNGVAARSQQHLEEISSKTKRIELRLKSMISPPRRTQKFWS